MTKDPDESLTGGIGITRRAALKQGLGWGAAAALPALLAACGNSSPSSAAASKNSVTFLVGGEFWTNWNPFDHFQLVQFGVQRNVFGQLVELSPSLKVMSRLARSWRQVNEHEWEFTLTPGIRFHNGKALTPADVKASIEAASGQSKISGKASTLSACWIPHEVEVLGAHRVRTHSAKPFAPLLANLSVTSIVQARDLADPKRLAARPVGTGSFYLTKDAPTKKSFAKSVAGYPQAKLRELVIESIPNSQTRLAALLAGQAQISQGVEPAQVATVRHHSGYTTNAARSLEEQLLFINRSKPPFDNIHARRALAWGVDRQAVRDLVGGTTQVATSHLAPQLPYHVAQAGYTYDPERARHELKLAGLATPVRMDLLGSTGEWPKSADATQLMAQQLQKAGFDVTASVVDLVTLNERIAKGPAQPNVMYAGVANITGDPDFGVSLYYKSPGAVVAVSVPEIDKLILQEQTTPNGPERGAVFAKLQTLLWSNLPSLPIIVGDNTVGLTTSTHGFVNYPTFSFDFAPVNES